MNTSQASAAVQLEYSFCLLEDLPSSVCNFHMKSDENNYAGTILI